MTCYDSVAKKDKIKYDRKFISMIDEWKKPLKDPFFFMELDHIDSYKPSEYCSNQGSSLLVLAYNFFPSIFDFNVLWLFPLVLSKSLSNWIGLLIPCRYTFHIIIERGGRNGGLFMYLLGSYSNPYVGFLFVRKCHACTLPWYYFQSTLASSC